jgi:tetratricopeptide (TPR) repeat protein
VVIIADMTPSPLPNAAPLNLPHALAQALELHRQGRLADAERLYAAILAVRPDHGDALHFLGLIRFATGQFGEALRLIVDAMRSGTPSPQVLLNHGIVLSTLKRGNEAIASFDRAIELKSEFSEAHNNRGVALAALGRHEEALESYRKALVITPNYADAFYNRGNVLKDLRRFDEALADYDRAIALRPEYAEAFCNRGVVLHELKRLEPALASYDRALALRPDIAEAHSNRGNVLKELKRFDAALASFDRALDILPSYPEALSNRGNVLHELKRYDEALTSFDRALALRPAYPEAISNRGVTLHALKRYDEALACHDRALALRPDYADALSNRGAALCEFKRHDEALASYDRALSVQPDMPAVHCNQATLRLLTGDLARGWAEYEWRWKKESTARVMRDFPQPCWLGGGEIAGKTILLHSEQGFGDTIQFCRYAPLVAARGAQVIVEVERPLQRLMTTLAGPLQVIAKGSPLPDFDLHCPLLSLPLAFGTELATIPAPVPYLRAPTQSPANWQRRLAAKRRPWIGLAWSGNPAHKQDLDRSIGLRALLPILDIDATFVSLQKDVRPADAAALAERDDILQVTDTLGDFSDTAALIAQLDLVISVDTSVVHLAGALGKPVWALLQYIPDWRWLLDREDSPWYPTARLFRQDGTRAWDGVVARVREALLERAQPGP